MKHIIWLFCALLLLVSGCVKEDVYTLSKEEVKVEVGSKEFDPISYLLKNDQRLSKEEEAEIKTGTQVDINVIGEYTFQFPAFGLNLKVIVEDTKKPELSLVGFDIIQWEVFTWNEESLDKLKAQVKDNYDPIGLLKKSLHCESIDTSRAGVQEITCQIEDSSGNLTKENVKINVIESNKKPENKGEDPVPGKIEKPLPAK